MAQKTAIGTASATAIALCVTIISHWEGMDLTAKHQSIDPPGVITACIGRTNYDDPTLKAGQHFTKAQCEQFLRDDLPKYDAMMRRCIHVAMPPHRYAAIVDFTYNVGGGTLCKSSVAREINAGYPRAGCNGLLAYTKANGRFLPGLRHRREDSFIGERTWCLRED